MRLGTTIRAARRGTQAALAAQVGISAQYLSDIEQGRRTPTNPELLERFAAALHLPADVLYYAAGQLPPECAIIAPDPTTIAAAFRALRTVLALPHPQEERP